MDHRTRLSDARHYSIQEFSVPELVGAFLPYHETPQFARMLQICKLE